MLSRKHVYVLCVVEACSVTVLAYSSLCESDGTWYNQRVSHGHHKHALESQARNEEASVASEVQESDQVYCAFLRWRFSK